MPDVCSKEVILQTSQATAHKAHVESKHFIHPYCFNLDTLGNCLSSLTVLDVLSKIDRYLKVFLNEILPTTNNLSKQR